MLLFPRCELRLAPLSSPGRRSGKRDYDVSHRCSLTDVPGRRASPNLGFKGGTNAQGTVIGPGGTDPLLAVFSGTGSASTMLTDASANPFGTSLDLSNFASFAGCPPGEPRASEVRQRWPREYS
jgi:hypothetical protein